MFSRNRVSALLIIVTLGLVSFFALPWTTRSAVIGGHTVYISGKTLVAAVVLGLIATGAQALASAEQPRDPCYVPAIATFWILPTLVTGTALAVLDKLNATGLQLMVVSATVAVLVALFLAEHHAADSNARLHTLSQAAVKVAAFPLLALLLAVLKTWPMPLMLLAATAGVCGGMVTYLVLSANLSSPGRAFVYAATSGLAMGMVGGTAASAVAQPAAYGLALTTALYVSTGLLQSYLKRDLRRGVVIEYLLVAAIGLLIVIASGR